MGGAQLSYGPRDGKRECALHERRLRSLCWMGGSVRQQLFVVHAKEGRTKTSVDVCSTNITLFTSIDGTVQILLLILVNENFISHMLHITCISLLFLSGFFLFIKVILKEPI
jgi:hypothetical protein